MDVRGTDLQGLLARHRDELVEVEYEKLRRSGLPHYMSLGQERLRERCVRLVDAFLAALGGAGAGSQGGQGGQGGPRGAGGPLGDHVERITRERIGEGYFLDEIQRALSFLEERTWEIVATESAPDEVVSRLVIVTQTIGAAKDRLARVYLDEKVRSDSRAEALQSRLNQLFGGTDPGPVGEAG